MAINFPDNPTIGDTYTSGQRTWRWDGVSWNAYGIVPDPTVLRVDSANGRVGINNSSPTTALDVTGDINLSGNITVGGSYVGLSSDAITDADDDTKIQVESSVDNDTITFTTGATPRYEIGSDGHLVPQDNEVYDLGSASNRFRDLYLSGSSIDLGGVTISSDGSSIAMPPISNIAGDFTVGTDVFHVDHANSRVGIGTTTPAHALDVNGAAVATNFQADGMGSYTATTSNGDVVFISDVNNLSNAPMGKFFSDVARWRTPTLTETYNGSTWSTTTNIAYTKSAFSGTIRDVSFNLDSAGSVRGIRWTFDNNSLWVSYFRWIALAISYTGGGKTWNLKWETAPSGGPYTEKFDVELTHSTNIMFFRAEEDASYTNRFTLVCTSGNIDVNSFQLLSNRPGDQGSHPYQELPFEYVGPYRYVTMSPTDGGYVPLTVRGISGGTQTANLQEWRDTSNNLRASMTNAGNFTAATKSFDIPHPLDPTKRLAYGSVEAPEHSIQIRGRSQQSTVDLPDYWDGLVDPSTITVQATPIGQTEVKVESWDLSSVVFTGSETLDFFYTISAERNDVDKLVVEYEDTSAISDAEETV